MTQRLLWLWLFIGLCAVHLVWQWWQWHPRVSPSVVRVRGARVLRPHTPHSCQRWLTRSAMHTERVNYRWAFRNSGAFPHRNLPQNGRQRGGLSAWSFACWRWRPISH